MNIYKFKDKSDGNIALILATNSYDAESTLDSITSLDFELIETKDVNVIHKPIIIRSDIAPF